MVLRALIIASLAVLLSGCGYRIVKTPNYQVKPDMITTMPQQGTVSFNYVYMDRDGIDAMARQIYRDQGLPWPFTYRLTGFFDYQTRTLYCELLDALMCGHELFHATHGDWHYR